MRRRVWVSDAAVISRRRRTVVTPGVRLDVLARGRRHIFARGFRGREWHRPAVKRRQLRRPGAPGNHRGYR